MKVAHYAFTPLSFLIVFVARRRCQG